MDIVISHSVALEVARRPYFHRLLPAAQGCSLDMPDRMPSPCELEEARRACPLLSGIDGPIGVLVSNHNAHHGSSAAVAHIRKGPIPRGGLIELAPGVRCASPNLVALQLAPRLSRIELLMLLSELLGLYTISSDEGGAELVQRSRPLAAPETMGAFLAQMRGTRCVAEVQRALRHAPVNAASPMEAKLFIRAREPYTRGGYAMGPVLLNDPVRLEALSSRVTTLKTRKPDLLFLGADGSEQRGACLDYMGSHHDQGSQVRRDTGRRNELIANGFSPYEIYKEHYDDLDYLDALMARIRSETGQPHHKVPPSRAAWEADRRRELWRELEGIRMEAWTRREDLR